MAISSRQYKANIRAAIKKLNSERPREALRIVQDLSTLIKFRIQGTGQNAEGVQFEDYTPEYAIYGRQRQGYQSEYVDFTRTGRLWASVQPQVIAAEATRTVIDLGPTGQENILKAAGQVRKRGNIITPSKEEIEIARGANNDRVLKVINEFL
jgi:hypothetical protein